MIVCFHLYRLLVSSCFLNGKTSSTCFLSNIYNCIELWMYFLKPELFVNRDLTKISTYLNFSQNSFALGSPYNFTSYATAKIFKLNIINLPLSKLIICTSWHSAHMCSFSVVFQKTYQEWFAALISWPLEYQNCWDSIFSRTIGKCWCGFVNCFCFFFVVSYFLAQFFSFLFACGRIAISFHLFIEW